jgi:hypothetical protein
MTTTPGRSMPTGLARSQKPEGTTECAVELHHLQNGAAKPRE